MAKKKPCRRGGFFLQIQSSIKIHNVIYVNSNEKVSFFLCNF